MSSGSLGVREQSSRFSETTRCKKNDFRAKNAETRWIAAVSAATARRRSQSALPRETY